MSLPEAQSPLELGTSSRRQALRMLSITAWGAFATVAAGCAETSSEPWRRPDWFRSKRGSTGKGGGNS